MKIGKPIRAYVVEPLEQPATPAEPEDEDETAQEPVAVRDTELETTPTA
jgi:hypothetical protein